MTWDELLSYTLFFVGGVEINVGKLFTAIGILLIGIIVSVLLIRLFLQRYYTRAAVSRKQQIAINRLVRYLVYALSTVSILNTLNLNSVLGKTFLELGKFALTTEKIIVIIIILSSSRLLVKVLHDIILPLYYSKTEYDEGDRYAVNQLLSYIIHTISFIYCLETLGFNLTVLWGGAAALLVGVGLGLQQTFNDLVSGIILLFERTVEVGHVVQVDTFTGIVRQIGLRTSKIETRENTIVVVPNSHLITRNLVNWKHNDDKVQFILNVRVRYGVDTDLVRKILVEVATEHPSVLDDPLPHVRLADFGDYFLHLELRFWSRELMPIIRIQSELRFEIDRAFRNQGILLPIPQREIWVHTMDKDDVISKNF